WRRLTLSLRTSFDRPTRSGVSLSLHIPSRLTLVGGGPEDDLVVAAPGRDLHQRGATSCALTSTGPGSRSRETCPAGGNLNSLPQLCPITQVRKPPISHDLCHFVSSGAPRQATECAAAGHVRR